MTLGSGNADAGQRTGSGARKVGAIRDAGSA
jgi:hypothetical protein